MKEKLKSLADYAVIGINVFCGLVMCIACPPVRAIALYLYFN